MTAVLRTKAYLGYTVPEENNTHIYFKKAEVQFWQFKHYLEFRLKSDKIILPWSTVYNDWQKSLNLIVKNSIRKTPSCITVFCKDLLEICKTFEGYAIKKSCEKLYNKFYQLSLDKQISERIRLLDSTIFTEQYNIDNIPSELFKGHKNKEVYDCDDEISDVKTINFSNEELQDFLYHHISQCLFASSAFFGILDLSEKDTEVKKLFIDDEWSEMKNDFSKTVEFKDIKEDDNKPEETNNS
ncbi:3235_t:CDS:2, partial [Diversispora eburnea]